MPGRSYSSTAYKYGFNGQEKDNEIYGTGNLNTAEFWQYDTRLGRRWNIDPVDFVSESPYACFHNNPIFFSDVSGAAPGEKDKNDLKLPIMKQSEVPSNRTMAYPVSEREAEKGERVTIDGHYISTPVFVPDPDNEVEGQYYRITKISTKETYVVDPGREAVPPTDPIAATTPTYGWIDDKHTKITDSDHGFGASVAPTSADYSREYDRRKGHVDRLNLNSWQVSSLSRKMNYGFSMSLTFRTTSTDIYRNSWASYYNSKGIRTVAGANDKDSRWGKQDVGDGAPAPLNSFAFYATYVYRVRYQIWGMVSPGSPAVPGSPGSSAMPPTFGTRAIQKMVNW